MDFSQPATASFAISFQQNEYCKQLHLVFGPLQALKYELQRQPALLGSSVFGYDDIYRTYQPFVQQWRQIAANCYSEPYIVTVDVSKAFDAVHVEKLLQLATPLLQSSHYLMVKYAEVTCLSLSPQILARQRIWKSSTALLESS